MNEKLSGWLSMCDEDDYKKKEQLIVQMVEKVVYRFFPECFVYGYSISYYNLSTTDKAYIVRYVYGCQSTEMLDMIAKSIDTEEIAYALIENPNTSVETLKYIRETAKEVIKVQNSIITSIDGVMTKRNVTEDANY